MKVLVSVIIRFFSAFELSPHSDFSVKSTRTENQEIGFSFIFKSCRIITRWEVASETAFGKSSQKSKEQTNLISAKYDRDEQK